MPITLTVADGYLAVRMYGVVTAQDFARYAMESEALTPEQLSLHRITDLTPVERFDVHYQDVFQLADRRKHQQQATPVRSAIIAREPVQIGMARMFQTVGDSEFIHVQVVHTLPEALEWIGVSSPTPTAT